MMTGRPDPPTFKRVHVLNKSSPHGKRIYYFGATLTEGSREMPELLGSKGANLAEMTGIGLPVPPGFTITTLTCDDFFRTGGKLPEGLDIELKHNIKRLESETGRKFGGSATPLLLSVRSGAAVSMPGMMDTILNLGLNDKTVLILGKTGNSMRFALDGYRRLINMFGGVVMGIDHQDFESAFDKIKKQHGITEDTDLDEKGLAALITAYKKIYKHHTGRHFPQDPDIQLRLAIEAVFRSWNTPRALAYRKINNITGLSGTAVNIQTMVFGNLGEDSGTGVAFTRDPATGENNFYGEFLVNAQGEDVVAGIRTPRPVSAVKTWRPDIYKHLLQIKHTLEQHYRDIQDIEFTVEHGKLYMLQTRTGKRTAAAAIRVAVDMANEGLITRETALLRVSANDLTQVLLPSFDPTAPRHVLGKGLAASPGAASGFPAFTADEAVERTNKGEKVILVRRETSPEDVHGMHVAAGILTATGGSTSHAAVVARGWGKCCVTGARDLIIDARHKTLKIGNTRIKRTDIISIDGSTGEIMAGEVATRPPVFSREFTTLMGWADKIRRLAVRANADTPEDAMKARNFGAQGIGLCRTEHMFFGEKRIAAMREMILADNTAARRTALHKLLPYQRRDFEGIFTAMRGLPVTIRLLDPPLHEFLPEDEVSQRKLARLMKISTATLQQRINTLHEINPMLGHRGCRLTITFPEILEMQVTAIVEAAINCRRKKIRAQPEIMIPLAGIDRELALLRELTLQTIKAVKKKRRFRGKLDIPIGTMIEVPRAALTADKIAEHADFFSFGTNDLTQMTFGYSRDDIGSFMPEYLQKKILDTNPFQSMDTEGVGRLVAMAISKGREAKAGLKCGICGEHGGDPDSIRFFQSVGLDYVSSSPFRIPVARLSAAQAVLTEEG